MTINPCPFCGAEKGDINNVGPCIRRYMGETLVECGIGGYGVGCGAAGPVAHEWELKEGETLDDVAMRKWNKRAK